MQSFNPRWLFPQTISDAKAAQNEMSQQVSIEDSIQQPLSYIAGVDVSNTPFDPQQMIFGAIVILSYPSLEIVETATQSMQQTFPYVPGLLGFREVPVLFQAYQQLTIQPDLLVVDGHGMSHPRGLGIATHLGLLLDKPTIGVAKSILVGKAAHPLPDEAGSSTPLIYKEKQIATLFRSKKKCSPLILSAGHKITLKTATEVVKTCLKGWRLPEPTRQAHLAANECRKTFQNTPFKFAK